MSFTEITSISDLLNHSLYYSYRFASEEETQNILKQMDMLIPERDDDSERGDIGYETRPIIYHEIEKRIVTLMLYLQGRMKLSQADIENTIKFLQQYSDKIEDHMRWRELLVQLEQELIGNNPPSEFI